MQTKGRHPLDFTGSRLIFITHLYEKITIQLNAKESDIKWRKITTKRLV